MKPIHVMVVGAGGRMGQEILRLIQQDALFVPAVGVGRNARGFNNNFTTLSEINKTLLKQVQVVIDFSSLEMFQKIIQFCVQNKLPLISGTTGISAEDKIFLEKAAKKIPILWSSNTSFGMSLLRKLIQQLSGLEKFDVQIVEYHHSKKKDKPSGTALTLQSDLISVLQLKNNVQDPISIRGGGIFGVHEIHLMSEEETIVVTHQALNRTVFARGALQLAKRLVLKKAAKLYSTADLY